MLIKCALLPWEGTDEEGGKEDKHIKHWKEDWEFAVDVGALCHGLLADKFQMLLKDERIVRNLDRLASLTTDVRTIYKPFVCPPLPLSSFHKMG